VLRDVPLEIDPAEVRAFQSYKPPLRLSAAELAARLQVARAEIAGLVTPRVAYRTVPVADAGPDHLGLAGGVRLAIPDIRRHWGQVEVVTAGVVTVGPDAEQRVRARVDAGDETGASVLDSAASAAVECLAEWANDHLCQLGVAAGWRVTNRISPGLAGWGLAGQPVLVALADATAIGVVAGPDGTLSPAKTIGLLVGAGPEARVDHYFAQCRRCWADGCPWRRLPAVARVHRGRKP